MKNRMPKLPDAGTVTVGLKMPNGLVLRTFTWMETNEPVMGGGSRTSKIATPDGWSVRLNGTAVPFGKTPRYMIIGGYAMTKGVDAAKFKQWYEENKDSDIVKNELIAAYSEEASTHDFADEHAKIRSGLEAIDPDNLPKGIQKVDPKEEQAAA